MAARQGLELGLLVGGDHVVVLAEGLAVKGSVVAVEHTGCLGGEVRVPREDP
jgi:hypothetical protein